MKKKHVCRSWLLNMTWVKNGMSWIGRRWFIPIRKDFCKQGVITKETPVFVGNCFTTKSLQRWPHARLIICGRKLIHPWTTCSSTNSFEWPTGIFKVSTLALAQENMLPSMSNTSRSQHRFQLLRCYPFASHPTADLRLKYSFAS